ncbi:TetR/AcrR family transcriptional regulator [Roseovarius aestuarii]|nr:TetR/AcrR family transcriptional regulator [Roseovarius aestuarii]
MTPILHRDDPDKDPLVGHVKVTREDWLNVARDVLVSEGVAEVKVLALGARLDVSRSSFYGYFKSRKHLLKALLDDWEDRNTKSIVDKVEMPASSISEAVCNFFRCFLDPKLFDHGLDFAVREWSRRDSAVRQRIDAADATRLKALCAMFERFGYSEYDADTRARILYFMQLGYHALELREPMSERVARLDGYLRGFTGADPDPTAIADLRDFVIDLSSR